MNTQEYYQGGCFKGKWKGLSPLGDSCVPLYLANLRQCYPFYTQIIYNLTLKFTFYKQKKEILVLQNNATINNSPD